MTAKASHRSRHASPAPLGDEPLVDEDGVDLTLIRCQLALTPRERLREASEFASAVERLRARNGVATDGD